MDAVLDTQVSRREDAQGEAIERASLISAQFVGPLPPPSYLAGYENVLPGSAERVLRLAEKEQEHRHKMEHLLLEAQIVDTKDDRSEARLGQVFALIIGITAILGGSVVSVRGAPLSGGFIGSSGVVGLAAVFITGRKERKAFDDDQGKISEVGD